MPAIETPGGYLIDVAELVSAPARAGQRSRPRGHAATDAATDTDTRVSVNATARAQLMAVRDEWLAPLVAQITTQAERIGHLEAERDELRRRVEAAETALSAIAHTDPPQAAPAAPSGAEVSPLANDTKGRSWGRLWWRWWGK